VQVVKALDVGCRALYRLIDKDGLAPSADKARENVVSAEESVAAG
jgi:hypothetical protein